MKKYVVEIAGKTACRVSPDAENAARRMYGLGALENGELESVAFGVEGKEGE